MNSRRLVIAGTHSGVGKTTVALGLMAALGRRGLVVQPFKVGPDFIDPGHHAAVCGRVCRNLDTWMLAEQAVRSTFAKAAVGADVCVIEGVMGLFDGRSADDRRGSTAHVARLLDAPVLLVVDASAQAASVAAVVKGFAELDPEVRVRGVICNRIAGARHYSYLEPAIRRHTRVEPVGWLPRRAEWEIPERHLGLVTREELGEATPGGRWEAPADGFAKTVDVERVLEMSGAAPLEQTVAGVLTAAGRPLDRRGKRVAVARDEAFCFYYQDNFDLLETAGAVLVPFSPLCDKELPAKVDLVYLGGGYPELHAGRLAGNHSMRESLRRHHQKGGAIYAECGGLMYCCRELLDTEGRAYPMLDLLPARTVMQNRRAALGYVAWRATRDTPFGPRGTELRGHEYHYSRLEPLEPLDCAAQLTREGEPARPDAFVRGNLLAGYAHLHFGSNPPAVEALLR